MKAPKEGQERWERTISRYFAAYSIKLKWSYPRRRFVGIAGHLFARLNPQNEVKMWELMPQTLKKYETEERNPDGKQVVIFVTNRRYGDSVDDSIVVMRLGTFMPMIKALVDSDKERWTDAASN